MFYSLAINDATVNAKLDKAIMLAPCLYIQDESTGKTQDNTIEQYNQLVGVYQAENVNLFASPNAALDEKKVCQPQPGAYKADDRTVACESIKIMNTLKGLPVKSFAQMYQVNIANRFQEYIPDFNEDNLESPLIEPGIKEATVPLRFIVAPKDGTCTLTQAYRVMKEYGGKVNISKLYDPEAGHESFIMVMDKPEFLA